MDNLFQRGKTEAVRAVSYQAIASYPYRADTQAKTSLARFWGPILAALTLIVWAASFQVGFLASLVAVILIGFVATVGGFYKPVLGVLGLGILCTLDPLARVFLFTGQVWRWNTLNYWLLLIMLLFLPLWLRRTGLQKWLLQAFIGLMVIGLSISPDLWEGLQQILGIAALFGLEIYFVRASRDERVWYWLGIVNGTVAAMACLAFFLESTTVRHINPNAFVYVPLSAIFSACLGTLNRKRWQWFTVLLLIVNAAWVFLTGSRGGLLIALLCVLFLLLTIPGFSRRSLSVISLVIISAAIVIQFSDLQEKSSIRILKLFDSSRSLDNRTSGRSELALAGWEMFLDRPLGVGTGGFMRAWKGMGTLGGRLEARFTGVEMEAHSGWIQVLAENGCLGVLLLGGYVFSFAAIGWRKRREGKLLLGSLASMVLATAFLTTVFQNKGLWFFAAGASVLLTRRNQDFGFNRNNDN